MNKKTPINSNKGYQNTGKMSIELENIDAKIKELQNLKECILRNIDILTQTNNIQPTENHQSEKPKKWSISSQSKIVAAINRKRGEENRRKRREVINEILTENQPLKLKEILEKIKMKEIKGITFSSGSIYKLVTDESYKKVGLYKWTLK